MSPKITATDPKIVRQLNKEAILESVRLKREGISRADVARVTTLSRATVSAIVDELLADGIVREAGVGSSSGGRRPTLLEINPNEGWVVGIDIGATHLLVMIANSRGEILAEHETDFDIADGPQRGIETVSDVVNRTLKQAGRTMSSLSAIATSVPGPVVAQEGMVVAPPIMPGWDGFPIRQHLAQRWQVPVYVDNDADLGALGEWAYGVAHGESNLAFIKIGTGIGCGILLDGQIYRGVLGTAGEIGHVTVREDGPPCVCGNYGCLEAMAGGRAIALRAQQAVAAGQRTSLASIGDVQSITARDVAAAAKTGDTVSQQLLSDAGRLIGGVLASLINLLNPGLVLLGGGVVAAGDYLLEPIRQGVANRSMRAALQATRVQVASLERRSTALGAVSLALTETFRQYVYANGTRQK